MHAMAKPGDITISLDDCMREINPDWVPYSLTRPERLSLALRKRNALLGSLAHATARCAWFVVASPCPRERAWWQDALHGRITLLDPGAVTCKQRALNRLTPRAIPGIERWYLTAGANDWRPPVRKAKRPKPVIGEDGWPVPQT